MRHLSVLAFLFALLLPAVSAIAGTIRVAVTPEVITDYKTLLAGRKPLAVTRYDGSGSRPEVVELLLVHQALALGGDARPIELVVAPTWKRMLVMVADGHADLSGSSVWASDIDADAARLQASSALVADGEFTAGIFHAASAARVRELVRQGKWTSLSAVSSHDLTPDWAALHRLGLAHIYDVPEWPAMARMVGAGRADFLLAPFPSRGGSLQVDDVVLDPVPGICLTLAGSRHLALARTTGDARLRKSLEQGLDQLRRRAAIRRAYNDAGLPAPSDPRCHPQSS